MYACIYMCVFMLIDGTILQSYTCYIVSDQQIALKAVIEPVDCRNLLVYGGWLSHGQSRHLSYFYIV